MCIYIYIYEYIHTYTYIYMYITTQAGDRDGVRVRADAEQPLLLPPSQLRRGRTTTITMFHSY